MSSPTASFVGSDLWNAEVYGTLSVASRTSAAIKDTQHLLRTRWSYMCLNKHLESFLDRFYSVFERAQTGKLASCGEPPNPEQVARSLESLWSLHHSLQGVYDLSVRKGLKKKLLLAGQVAMLAQSKERLLDVIQWISEMSNPEEVRAMEELFALASDELERGETVSVH